MLTVLRIVWSEEKVIVEFYANPFLDCAWPP